MSIDTRYRTSFHYEKGFLIVMLRDTFEKTQKIIHKEPLNDKNSKRARNKNAQDAAKH